MSSGHRGARTQARGQSDPQRAMGSDSRRFLARLTLSHSSHFEGRSYVSASQAPAFRPYLRIIDTRNPRPKSKAATDRRKETLASGSQTTRSFLVSMGLMIGASLMLLLVGLAACGEEPVDRRWLLGDLHVHVSPPDDPGHSTLTVESAIAKALEAKLDFLVLTPHVPPWGIPGKSKDPVRDAQVLVRRLARESLATRVENSGDGANGAQAGRRLVVVAGWEYTRGRMGHLGISFADLTGLVDLSQPLTAAGAIERDALVVINHPFFGPVPSSALLLRALAKGDWRWRPFHSETVKAEPYNAIEVWHERSALIEQLYRAQADEIPETQMVRSAFRVWDRATRDERRRIVAVGGSDAHGRLPYVVSPLPVISVRVRSADEAGLREGLLAGRVTFGRRGGVDAQDFTATSDVEGAWGEIGSNLRADREIRLSWSGPARLFENGEDVGDFENGTVRKLPTPGEFAFWRIEKPHDQFSNMIYANLPE